MLECWFAIKNPVFAAGFEVERWPEDEQGLENLARYIIRACFSQERMVYIPVAESTDGKAKVIYTSKEGRTRKTFDALDWLAHNLKV